MIQPTDNLTSAKIKKWAYKKLNQQMLPQLEDIHTVLLHADILFTLVCDDQCPQRSLILHTLYSVIGKTLSTGGNDNSDQIKALLLTAEKYNNPLIVNLISRTKIILQNLRKYDYVEWCAGGFVQKDLLQIS